MSTYIYIAFKKMFYLKPCATFQNDGWETETKTAKGVVFYSWREMNIDYL